MKIFYFKSIAYKSQERICSIIEQVVIINLSIYRKLQVMNIHETFTEGGFQSKHFNSKRPSTDTAKHWRKIHKTTESLNYSFEKNYISRS